ncbi:MAG: DUF3842 family protein [Nitrospira sp.]|nr:DUF3842 family protein [Nitrospira sp.]
MSRTASQQYGDECAGILMKPQICVIDGRGGGLGGRLVTGLNLQLGKVCDIIGLGTNTVAAEVMKAAGATRVEVGIEAIVAVVPSAEVILGTLNLVLPGAMLGEITPELVAAVLSSKAKKVLLPVNRAHMEIVGTEDHSLEVLITRSLSRVRRFVSLSR